MTQAHEVRRHADGSIDFDFYRARARALRMQAIRDVTTVKATDTLTLVTAAAAVTVAVAAIVAAAPTQLS